jgi:hypothetical protein
MPRARMPSTTPRFASFYSIFGDVMSMEFLVERLEFYATAPRAAA